MEVNKMIEYTEEQKLDIAETIKKVREVEQWRIAGDTYYRAANAHMTQLVQQGVYDPYILQVGQALHNAFRQANSINQQQAPPADEAPKED
jgi:hypothetical protein